MIFCRPMPTDSADAAVLMRGFMTELVDRYHGRTMPVEVVDEELALLSNDDLVVFLIAYRGDEPVGCVGMRLLGPATGEVSRMFVVPAARRLGVGTALLDALEERAAALGLGALRLDTRDDLIEARALYARRGYAEIPAYKVDKYAEHFFEKQLT